MSTSTAKNNILKKIRLALTNSTPIPFPKTDHKDSFFQPLQQDIVVEFAEQFTQLQGRFVFCADERELHVQLNQLFAQQEWTRIFCHEEKFREHLSPSLLSTDISSCEASITSCEALVARTGSMLLSTENSGRVNSVYAPVHICIAYTSQMVYDIKDGLQLLSKKYGQRLPSMISLATGPSRTADIEKTLVVGVHGPKEVFCFLVEDSIQAP